MKPLEVWTCQRAENLKRRSHRKFPKKTTQQQWYRRRADKLSAAAAARPSKKIRGGGAHKLSAAAAPTNCRRRRRRGRRTALILHISNRPNWPTVLVSLVFFVFFLKYVLNFGLLMITCTILLHRINGSNFKRVAH